MPNNGQGQLWQKGVAVEDWITRFTVGEDYRWDTLLLPYDMTATLAHAQGLVQIEILTPEEWAAVEEALAELRLEVEAGRVVVTPQDEDCHTVIEHYLTDRVGEAGKKIHTGRSRNDQVLAALRLFLRESLQRLGREVVRLAEVLCELGEKYNTALMPGYTHLQRAMPSTAGLWAMGFAELLADDLAALRAAHDQVNVSPLGSAAGYGVPHLNLPREAVAEALGFNGVQTHVTAVQLSRGKQELHVLHALVQVGATINRLASDLVLYNTAEFGFVTLPAAYCTGSSIMPQKQNPDVLELARAYYHRLIAEMQVLLTLPANLPSGYHRDLQLTKEAVMRGVLLAHDLLAAMNSLVPHLAFNTGRMREAATAELFATAAALERVRAGVPFREAYRQAAQSEEAWRLSLEEGLAVYETEGTPGQVNADLVRDRLQRAASWIP